MWALRVHDNAPSIEKKKLFEIKNAHLRKRTVIVNDKSSLDDLLKKKKNQDKRDGAKKSIT